MPVTFAPAPVIEEPSGERASPSTVFALFWAFATFVWSIFTPPQYTFPARLLLLQPIWILRVMLDDDTYVQDLWLFLVLHAGFTFWTGAWSLPDILGLVRSVDAETLHVYVRVFAALGGCGVLAGGIVWRGQQLSKEGDSTDSIKTINENPLPPLLIPSRTTHSRFVPKKHSFSYSYLFVGVPVGVTGRFGSALSVDCAKRGWFHVDAADHLSRATSTKTLSEKLSAYLHSQGIKDSEYEFAYLVTAPRFLGYNFNPVSFWYVYDEDMVLKFMIPEVNNTFGERRIYLLRPSNRPADQIDEDGNTVQTNGHGSKAVFFTQTWEKDFHVSPFNSRKGSYSIRTIDPLNTGSDLKFDTTIVLRTSKDEAKIVARVFSEGATLDPSSVGLLGLTGFITSWWWVGLMTLPRILWEARKLYFARALNLYFRPEVTNVSIGRAYTGDEEKLESFFRIWLTQVAEEAQEPLRLIYEPPHAPNELVIYSSAFSHAEDRKQTLTLKVITPAFYSRFVHYAHAQEAFDRESLATDDQNRTAVIEPASLMPVFLNAIKHRHQRVLRVPVQAGPRWTLMEWLRCPAAAASFTNKTNELQYVIKDIRKFRASELDTYVRLRCDEPDIYRRAVTKLFLAQRFLLGVPVLLDAVDITFRAVLWLLAMAYIDSVDFFDVLRPERLTSGDSIDILFLLSLANAIHIWALMKG
ncbi:hypothetical protein AMS68_000141 [Peltaster fructicola]|uniref:DUF1365 domain-containing protein n=1 Tax=Peltaster fructicola TaxID=286661 RepID=A0A6H0XIT5_9PEZI|nr:hypothetical protein AMS68_000141 [Peltaster fructicola]